MGGMGSGRWGGHRKKEAVEDCRRITLGEVIRPAPPTAGRTGTLTWSRGEAVTASVGFTIVAEGDGLAIRLAYTWTAGGTTPGPPKEVSLDVRLVRLQGPRDGGRWLGICPLIVNGTACRRRVALLYLAPRSLYAGCRKCHDLTYRSRQEHDPRVTRLLRNPGAVHRMACNVRQCSVPQLMLLLKATTIQERRTERDSRGVSDLVPVRWRCPREVVLCHV